MIYALCYEKLYKILAKFIEMLYNICSTFYINFWEGIIMKIDYEALRNYIIDEFYAAAVMHPAAIIYISAAERASDEEQFCI